MNSTNITELGRYLETLCRRYKVPLSCSPDLDISDDYISNDCVGLYLEFQNTIWLYSGLNFEEAVKTLRHEFGHFILKVRDPKRKYTRREETICKMMETTLLRFPHLTNNRQQALESFMEKQP